MREKCAPGKGKRNANDLIWELVFHIPRVRRAVQLERI